MRQRCTVLSVAARHCLLSSAEGLQTCPPESIIHLHLHVSTIYLLDASDEVPMHTPWRRSHTAAVFATTLHHYWFPNLRLGHMATPWSAGL